MTNESAARIPSIQPRFIRCKYAPGYLGMGRAEFNKTVRPHVREFPIGKQGIGFDRIELDRWADAYVDTHSVAKRLPERKSAKAIDPHAKPKEDFERALAMVMGKPKSRR